MIIGYDSGSGSEKVTLDQINELTNETGGLYLEVGPDFRKGLDIMMRRFVANMVRIVDE